MILFSQIRVARAPLGWKQSELAATAGVSLAAVNNMERGSSDPRASALSAVTATLEAAGVEFTNGDGPGVRLHGR